ncbi:MAG: class I SAM-dependent methyltransferase [Oligoflexia bacterium]|nr:class I SAM-dependent methyltransferase [Oligoflexia bacterium]
MDNNFNQMWNQQEYVARYNQVYPLLDQDCQLYCDLLQIKMDDHLLDLGCGEGYFVKKLLEMGIKKITVVDVSGEQLLRLREKLTPQEEQKLTIIEGDFESISFPQEQVTKVFARASLHHLDQLKKRLFFQKLKSVTKKSALFLLHDMVFDFPKEELNQQMPRLLQEASVHYGDRWILKKEDIIATWFDEFPEDFKTWISVCKEGGLELVGRKRITSFLSILLFSKI